AAARVAFAGGAIHGVWRAALFPVVSVSGLRGPDVAFRAATGLEYRVRTTTLGVEYSLERYDFPAEGGVRRLEPLSAVTLRRASDPAAAGRSGRGAAERRAVAHSLLDRGRGSGGMVAAPPRVS